MANSLKRGNLKEAVDAYKKAIAIKPDYADAYNNLGVALQDRDTIDDAIDAFKKAITIKPDYVEAHRNLSTITRYTRNNPQLEQLKKLLKNTELNTAAKCNINFTLAKIYEDIDELSKAFEHLAAGNALRKKALNYSITQDHKLFQQIKK